MITVRPATEADLPQFLALLRHLQPGDPAPDPDKARTVFARMVSGDHTIVFLAVSGDALAASCTLTIIANLTRDARPATASAVGPSICGHILIRRWSCRRVIGRWCI